MDGLRCPILGWFLGIVNLTLWANASVFLLTFDVADKPGCPGNSQNQMTQEVLSQLQIISAQQSKIGGSRDKLRMFGKVRLHSASALTPVILITNVYRHIGLVRSRYRSPYPADLHGCSLCACSPCACNQHTRVRSECWVVHVIIVILHATSFWCLPGCKSAVTSNRRGAAAAADPNSIPALLVGVHAQVPPHPLHVAPRCQDVHLVAP